MRRRVEPADRYVVPLSELPWVLPVPVPEPVVPVVRPHRVESPTPAPGSPVPRTEALPPSPPIGDLTPKGDTRASSATPPPALQPGIFHLPELLGRLWSVAELQRESGRPAEPGERAEHSAPEPGTPSAHVRDSVEDVPVSRAPLGRGARWVSLQLVDPPARHPSSTIAPPHLRLLLQLSHPPHRSSDGTAAKTSDAQAPA